MKLWPPWDFTVLSNTKGISRKSVQPMPFNFPLFFFIYYFLILNHPNAQLGHPYCRFLIGFLVHIGISHHNILILFIFKPRYIVAFRYIRSRTQNTLPNFLERTLSSHHTTVPPRSYCAK